MMTSTSGSAWMSRLMSDRSAPAACWPTVPATSAALQGAEAPVPAWPDTDAVLLGEIALSGELRPAAHAPLRLKEAAKLGFGRAMLPAAAVPPADIRLESFARLAEFVDRLLGRG